MPADDDRSIRGRARNGDLSLAPDPQDGLFDQEIDDASLVELLDERERRRERRARANAAFKEKDEAAKARIEEFGLEPGEVARVGRYRVKVTETAGRSVSFETSSSRRMTIKLLDS